MRLVYCKEISGNSTIETWINPLHVVQLYAPYFNGKKSDSVTLARMAAGEPELRLEGNVREYAHEFIEAMEGR